MRSFAAVAALPVVMLALFTPGPLRGQYAAIDNVWVEHNVWEGGLPGMRIHTRFHIDGMRGQTGRAIAYFAYDGGTPLRGSDGTYEAFDRQVSVGLDFTPGYDETTYDDLTLFMPYDQLHMAPGRYDLEFDVRLYAHAAATFLAQTAPIDFVFDLEPDVAEGDVWRQQVISKLDLARTLLTSEGWAPSHEIEIGSLYDGETDAALYHLAAGTSYGILGVCDDDCSDVDLILYDPAGNVVDSDYELDAYPSLTIVPAWSGTFTVEVSMAECSRGPCRWGVGVYASK